MKVNIGNYPSSKSTKKRKEEVIINSWDSYSAYHTMSLIIHPLLIDFKKKSIGVPSSFIPDDYSDKNHKKVLKEWKIVIDKMIWSFDQIKKDFPGENKAFKKNGKKFSMKKDDETNGSTITETGFSFDKEKYDEYYKKVQEGIDLFAKYYINLWW